MIVEMTSFLLMSHRISKLLTSFLRGAVRNICIDRLRYFSIYVDESIPNDQQAISEAIEHLKAIAYLFSRRWRRDYSKLKRAAGNGVHSYSN
ncbi:hypothetical protein EGN34_09990 [Enterococcus faecalis]|nr:hypothetical protein [Enterococcus faecalis]